MIFCCCFNFLARFSEDWTFSRSHFSNIVDSFSYVSIIYPHLVLIRIMVVAGAYPCCLSEKAPRQVFCPSQLSGTKLEGPCMLRSQSRILVINLFPVKLLSTFICSVMADVERPATYDSSPLIIQFFPFVFVILSTSVRHFLQLKPWSFSVSLMCQFLLGFCSSVLAAIGTQNLESTLLYIFPSL